MVIQIQLAIETVSNNQASQSVEVILVQPVGGGCLNEVVVGQRLHTFTEEELRVYKLFHAPQRYLLCVWCMCYMYNINLFVLRDG